MDHDILNGIKNVKQSSQSLPDQVAEQISKLIIERHLSAGEQLPNEFELAEQLNIGRGSVREAVKILAARNVLELRRGKGTFIAKNTGMVDDPFGFAYLEDEYRLAQELFAIRQRMEPWIASIAAERATAEDIVDLRRLQHNVEDMIRRGEYYLYEDQHLHARIADCTGNRVLPMMIPVITYSVHLFGALTKMSLLQETIDTHAQIVDAIEAHDPDAARAAMEEHLRHNRMALPQTASETP